MTSKEQIAAYETKLKKMSIDELLSDLETQIRQAAGAPAFSDLRFESEQQVKMIQDQIRVVALRS